MFLLESAIHRQKNSICEACGCSLRSGGPIVWEEANYKLVTAWVLSDDACDGEKAQMPEKWDVEKMGNLPKMLAKGQLTLQTPTTFIL